MYHLHPAEMSRLAELEMAERHRHAERVRFSRLALRARRAARR